MAYEEGCYFEDTKSPIRSDRGGSLNISKAEGYDCIYKGCDNLMEGYTNIDGAKVSKSFGVIKTDWVPTQTVASYTQHYLDKTEDVPAICKKYAVQARWRYGMLILLLFLLLTQQSLITLSRIPVH